MNGSEAIETIAGCLSDELIVACNGMISRKLYHLADRPENFYMLGSMGLTPAIGLGIALARPDKKIIVLSGDGNVLMSLGTLATIGKTSPRNLICIVLDNECHESTGGQETASPTTKLYAIASSCHFDNSHYVSSPEVLRKVLRRLLNTNATSFIHVKIDKERIDSKRVPRVSLEPVEIRNRFMANLGRS